MKTNESLSNDGRRSALRKAWRIFAQFVWIAAGILVLTAVIALTVSLLSGLFKPWIFSGSGDSAVFAAQTAGSAREPTFSFHRAAARARPSVVNMYSAKQIPGRRASPADPLLRVLFGKALPAQRVTSLGSGVIGSREVYVLTNNHVIEVAEEIAVVLADRGAAPATRLGADPETDFAVLKLGINGLTPIALAKPDQIEVGDIVLEVGNHFGVGQTVTMGIVSALDRRCLGVSPFENFIQTNAAINPGNAGDA